MEEGDTQDAQARVAEMQAKQKQQEGQQQEVEEQIRVMMAQILTPAARERCKFSARLRSKDTPTHSHQWRECVS